MTGPHIGMIVNYHLTPVDANAINNRRAAAVASVDAGILNGTLGAQLHMGTPVKADDTFPMIVTRVWQDDAKTTYFVSGQVFLDGNDTYWAQGEEIGEVQEPGVKSGVVGDGGISG